MSPASEMPKPVPSTAGVWAALMSAVRRRSVWRWTTRTAATARWAVGPPTLPLPPRRGQEQHQPRRLGDGRYSPRTDGSGAPAELALALAWAVGGPACPCDLGEPARGHRRRGERLRPTMTDPDRRSTAHGRRARPAHPTYSGQAGGGLQSGSIRSDPVARRPVRGEIRADPFSGDQRCGPDYRATHASAQTGR